MQQFFQFVIHHWVLWSVFVLILALLFWQESFGFSSKQIKVPKAVELINHEKAVLIDLRDANSYATSHILHSINIPENDFAGDSLPRKILKHKSKIVILIGANSQQALKILSKLNMQGFNKVYSLSGGVEAWTTANLPLIKK